ncbi:TenA family protein [Fodinibius halophilus]|uniref:Aminopyrimidine aminohydrolase n=1 Tax=Fodinibius halophilus TaxID=1736908 RepID=A0A6M1T3N2_9BACT|nr:TenA family protein [Fodinibius halophilus]NGP88687.1 transcriptional regulator [Fodinibius halophilus]
MDTLQSKTSFEEWTEQKSNGRFTNWLKAIHQEKWESVINHRFTNELGEESLDKDTFSQYLVQDYAFVDQLVKLIGHAIGTAPSLEDRIPLVNFLGQVTSEENTYFQRSFEALDIPEKDQTDPQLLPATKKFQQLMAEAGRSLNYANIITVFIVAEWSYLSWASRISERSYSKFYFGEWVSLHANPEFRSFVDWLRNQLDQIGPTLSTERQQEISELFEQSLDCEQAFFDSAYL